MEYLKAEVEFLNNVLGTLSMTKESLAMRLNGLIRKIEELEAENADLKKKLESKE